MIDLNKVYVEEYMQKEEVKSKARHALKEALIAYSCLLSEEEHFSPHGKRVQKMIDETI